MMVNENPVIFPQVSYHFLYTSPRVTETREYEVTTFSSFTALVDPFAEVLVLVVPVVLVFVTFCFEVVVVEVLLSKLAEGAAAFLASSLPSTAGMVAVSSTD